MEECPGKERRKAKVLRPKLLWPWLMIEWRGYKASICRGGRQRSLGVKGEETRGFSSHKLRKKMSPELVWPVMLSVKRGQDGRTLLGLLLVASSTLLRGFHGNSCDHCKGLALQCLQMALENFLLFLHPNCPLYLPSHQGYGIGRSLRGGSKKACSSTQGPTHQPSHSPRMPPAPPEPLTIKAFTQENLTSWRTVAFQPGVNLGEEFDKIE